MRLTNIEKERFDKFLISREKVFEDKTLSSNALKIAKFLCKGIESEDDFVNSFNLSILVRGGKFRDELKMSGEELEKALNELNEKGYTLFY